MGPILDPPGTHPGTCSGPFLDPSQPGSHSNQIVIWEPGPGHPGSRSSWRPGTLDPGILAPWIQVSWHPGSRSWQLGSCYSRADLKRAVLVIPGISGTGLKVEFREVIIHFLDRIRPNLFNGVIPAENSHIQQESYLLSWDPFRPAHSSLLTGSARSDDVDS